MKSEYNNVMNNTYIKMNELVEEETPYDLKPRLSLPSSSKETFETSNYVTTMSSMADSRSPIMAGPGSRNL